MFFFVAVETEEDNTTKDKVTTNVMCYENRRKQNIHNQTASIDGIPTSQTSNYCPSLHYNVEPMKKALQGLGTSRMVPACVARTPDVASSK